MPKGDNPNSRKNLEKGKATRFVKGDTRAKIGHIASNKAQAEKRSIQERARIVLNTLITRKNGDKIDMFSAGCEKAAAQWVLTGDPKYGKAIAELAGEVVQKVEQVVITPEVDFDKLKELRKALKGKDE